MLIGSCPVYCYNHTFVYTERRVLCYKETMVSEEHVLLSQLPGKLFRSVVQDALTAGQKIPRSIIVGVRQGVVYYYRVAELTQPFPP